jgi:hypothetical protein
VLVEFIAEQSADRQLLVLTCHEHVARIFHEAGAHVRSFADPRPLWGRPAAAPRATARSVPDPVVIEPVAAPQPVVAVAPAPPAEDGDLWPAEAFFFADGAAAAPRPSPRPAATGRRRPRRR